MIFIKYSNIYRRRQLVHLAQCHNHIMPFRGRRRVDDPLLEVEHLVGEFLGHLGHRTEVDGKVAQQHFVGGNNLVREYTTKYK